MRIILPHLNNVCRAKFGLIGVVGRFPLLNRIGRHESIFDMSPQLTSNCLTDRRLRNFIFLSYVPLVHLAGCVIFSYCLNNGFIQFGRRKIASLWISVSPFLKHIGSVILSVAKKKVTRIAALFIIAVMKNPHSFWDWSSGNSPCQSMSKLRLWKTRTPISSIEAGKLPFPTFIRFSDLYFLPKALFNQFWIAPSSHCGSAGFFCSSGFCCTCSRFAAFFAKYRRCLREFIHAAIMCNRLRMSTQFSYGL